MPLISAVVSVGLLRIKRTRLIGLMVGSLGCIGILALLGVWSQFESGLPGLPGLPAFRWRIGSHKSSNISTWQGIFSPQKMEVSMGKPSVNGVLLHCHL